MEYKFSFWKVNVGAKDNTGKVQVQFTDTSISPAKGYYWCSVPQTFIDEFDFKSAFIVGGEHVYPILRSGSMGIHTNSYQEFTRGEIIRMNRVKELEDPEEISEKMAFEGQNLIYRDTNDDATMLQFKKYYFINVIQSSCLENDLYVLKYYTSTYHAKKVEARKGKIILNEPIYAIRLIISSGNSTNMIPSLLTTPGSFIGYIADFDAAKK